MIECQEVVKEYSRGLWRKKRKRVLDGVSLTIRPGETYALCGMSGSGKSTLGRVMLGLIPATGGHVCYDGKELSTILRSREEAKMFRCRNQILFQNPQAALYPDFTIRRLLEEPYHIHAASLGALDWDWIYECLRRVRLDGEILDRYPAQLSGGQLQRVSLARLLFLRPSFIVLDEPTTMLDPTAQEEIILLLKELQRTEHLTYLYISHQLDIVRYMADTVGVLHEGKIVAQGTVADILNHPRHPFVQAFVKEFDQL